MDQMHFPVLWFAQGTCGRVANGDELRTCSPTALRKGFYKGLLVVDVRGYQFRVVEARKSGYPGRFWGWGFYRLSSRCKPEIRRMIMVDLVYDMEVTRLSLDELKGHVIKMISQNRDYWSEYMMSWHEMKDKIGQAKSFEDIMSLPFLE